MFRITPLAAAVATLGALTGALPAVAQVVAPAAPAPAAKSAEIQEVVVTAQKRVQSSSKVSAALSVVSDEDIKDKGINSAANLTELVPNLQVGQGGVGGMEITIRGIGNSDNTERGDPQAAFHVDGIYIGRTQGAGASFFDLERVEVLRGPQGTLYGRNANAGAINVLTRKPSSKLEGQINAEFGNYNAQRLEGMVNVPVSQSFALRAVVSKQKHDGFADSTNATNGFTKDRDDQDNTSARVQGLLKFSPSASLRVGFDTSKNRGSGQASYDISSGKLPTDRSVNPDVQGLVNNTAKGSTAELNVGTPYFDVAYLFGHRETKRQEAGSFGPSPGLITDYHDAFTQNSHELRLSSNNTSALQWVLGAYTFKEDGRDIDLDVFLPAAWGGGRAVHFVQSSAVSESQAVFGQLTYSMAPDLRAIAGVRNTHDSKGRVGQTRVGPADTPLGVVGNLANGAWSKMTYRLGLEHDLNKDQMVYASLSTGYKAGGFNDGNGVVGDPNYNQNLYYNPEGITAFEAGLKGRFLANKLQLGAAVFLYDYTDLQKSAVINNSLNTVNAAKAKVSGLELDGRFATSADGRVNFALGLLSSKYKAYTTPNGQDFSGQALDKAPQVTLSVGYTHHWDLDSGASISAYLGSRYTASYVLSDTGTATQAPRLFTQPATTKSDLTLTYAPASDKWSVQAFAKNLEDVVSLSGLATINGQNLGYLSEARTFGVRASVKF